MPKQLVIYNNSDSSIWGYVKVGADSDSKLYPLEQNQTVLEIPLDHPALSHQDQYKIADGQLVQKNIVKLSASSPTFPADGTSSVQITFDGLNAPTGVGVAGQKITVSPNDNVLTLTADAPQPFTLQVNDDDHWSEPLTVEAQ